MSIRERIFRSESAAVKDWSEELEEAQLARARVEAQVYWDRRRRMYQVGRPWSGRIMLFEVER